MYFGRDRNGFGSKFGRVFSTRRFHIPRKQDIDPCSLAPYLFVLLVVGGVVGLYFGLQEQLVLFIAIMLGVQLVICIPWWFGCCSGRYPWTLVHTQIYDPPRKDEENPFELPKVPSSRDKNVTEEEIQKAKDKRRLHKNPDPIGTMTLTYHRNMFSYGQNAVLDVKAKTSKDYLAATILPWVFTSPKARRWIRLDRKWFLGRLQSETSTANFKEMILEKMKIARHKQDFYMHSVRGHEDEWEDEPHQQKMGL
jgi:hypothetical protein